jgi:ABC-type polysaccharide/polyol phosphate transport system, ATPase component
MNGTMMGFGREEMEKKLPEILEFADIGDFVHQPVKTYSSGMFVRLAFALAINVEPEILIVDEALSVGDVFFQAKCYKKMDEIRQKGTTILMVTHDMGSVIKYCDKVILLNKGSFVAEGKAGEIVDLYKKILANRFEIEEEAKGDKLPVEAKAANTGKLMKESLSINPNVTEYGDKRAEIYDLGLIDSKGEISNLLIKGEEFTIRERIRFFADIKQPIFTYTIKDKKGTELSGTNTMFELTDIEEVHAGDSYDVEFRQKMNLQGGEYLISMSCTGFENGQHVVYHRLYDVANITVISNKNTVGIYDMESRVSVSLHRK